MANFQSLADELKPYLFDDQKFQSELRKTVVIDLDIKDAQKEFGSMQSMLNSMKEAIKQVGVGTKESASMMSDFGKTAGVALAVVGEKFRQVEDQIKKTAQEIVANNQRIESAGNGSKTSGLVKKLEQENQSLEKLNASRAKLAEEYKRQAHELNGELFKDGGNDSSVDKKIQAIEKTNKSVNALGETMHKVYNVKTGQYDAVDAKKLQEYQAQAEKNRKKDEAYAKSHADKSFGFKFKEEQKKPAEIVKGVKPAFNPDRGENGAFINGQWMPLKDIRTRKRASVLDTKVANTSMGKGSSKDDQVEEEKKKIHGLLGTLKEYFSVKAQLSAQQTSMPLSGNVEESQKNIKELETRLKNLRTIFSSMKESVFVQALGAIGSAIKNASKLALSSMSAFANLAKQGFNILANGAKALVSAIGSLISHGFNALKSAVSGTLSAINMLNSGVKKAITTIASLAKSGFGALKNGVTSAISGIKNIIGHFKKLGGDTTKRLTKSLTSLKSMLMRRVKRTFISAIFNQAKEGLQQLAKYDKGFNQAMSDIKNSAKQAAGNLSVAMGNLITTLAPAINFILNLLSTLFEKLNAIFALLTGKTAVTVAKRGTDDYAQSLNNASGAAKDLNKQLYGFDEITRQDDNNGGGGGKIQYEQSDVDGILGGMKDAIEEIKQAFENGEFEKVGELIAKQLNQIIYKIDDFIVKIRPKAVEWSKNIARILNGLVSGWDAKATGKLLADGLNLVLDVVNTFLETFDFTNLGKKFAEMMNGLFDNVEWDLLGKTAANYFNAFWKTLNGFVRSANWEKYGKSFAQAFNSFFKTLDWSSISGAIASGLNGIFKTLSNFIANVEWDDISKNVFICIRNAMARIQWVNIGKTISDGINAALIVAWNLFDSNIISEFGGKIGSLLGSALKNIEWSKLGETVANGIAEIQKMFTNFVEELDLPSLGTNLAEGLQSMFDNIDWSAREEAVTTGFNSIVEGLSNFITNVEWSETAREFAESTNRIIEGIKWDELANTVKTGFNAVVSSLATVVTTFDFASLGKHIGTSLDTMLNGINWEDVRKLLAGYINGLADLFYNFVTSVNWKDIATNITTELDNLVSGGNGGIDWSKIQGALTESINALIDIFNTLVTSDTIVHLAENLGSTIGGVLDGINFDELAKTAHLGFTKLVAAFKGIIERINFPNIAKKIGEGIKSFFEPDKNGRTVFDDAVDLVETGIKTIVATFGTLADKILGTEVVDGQTVNLGSKIAEAINSLFANTGEEDSLFNQIGETIGNAISNVFKNILTFVTDTNFGDIAQGLFDMISSGIDNVFGGEDAGFNKDRARRFGESISKAISDVLSNATQFLEDVDFAAIGESIGSMLGSIDWLDIGKKFLKLLWAGLTGALSLIGGVASEFFKRIFGIADPSVIDATSLEWANQFADGLEDGLQNGEFKQRLASAATLVATGLGDDLIEANKQAESMYSGFAESVALSLNNVFQGLSESSDARIGLMAALGLDNADVELRNAMTQFLEDIKNFEGELTSEDILQGIYNNSESAEKLKEYFNSLGLDAPQALLDSLVGQRPRVNEASKHLLDDLQSAQNFEQVKEAWRAQGVEVSDAFAKSLVGIGNENIASALMLLGSGIDEATIAALDTTHLSEYLNEFMEENGTSIEETIGALLLASGHDLEEVSAILGKDAGYLLSMSLPEGMIKGISDGKQTVQEAADEFKAMAVMDDEDAQEARQSSENVGSGVTEGMSSELDNGKEGVGTSAENVVKTIDDKIKELPESEQENAKKMMEMMVEGILEGDPLVQSAIEKSAKAVVEKVEKILSNGEGRRIVNDFLSGMKDSINANFELTVSNPLVSASGQMITSISERLSKDNGKTIITWFMEGMADAIDDFNTTVSDPLLGKIDGIVTALEDADFNTIGYNVIYRMLDGMKNAIAENFDSMVYSPISSYADGIATVLENSASYSDGYSITFNILQGMYDAIANGNGQEVVNLFGQVIQALIDTAKEALDINSPSKVFAEIGEYTMQGMEIGILESGEDAVDAVTDVAKAMAKEGSGLSFSASIDNLSDGLDVATGKLSRIAEIFSGIADALTQMGGLNIPTIATGQSIPYRTQLGTTSSSVGVSDTGSIEDAIYSAFTRAISGIDNEQGINITLMIDGRKMADIVTKYQRQQGRAVGV